MKKIGLFILIMLLSIMINAKVRYDIFAMYSISVKQGKPTSIPKGYFIKIVKDKNILTLGDINKYSLYNKKITHNGFNTFERYDAIDKYDQRCVILFNEDASATDWWDKCAISICYENSDKAVVYLSKKPQTIE